jgi:glutamyl-tRNA synthetase
MNGMYIRALAPDDLAERLLPFLREAGLPATIEQARSVAPLVQERLTALADAASLVDFLWADEVAPAIGDMIPKGMDSAAVADLLATAEVVLRAADPWTHAELEAALRGLATDRGLKLGPALQPIRLAVTGKTVSPPLFESLEVLGRERALARVAAARGLIGAVREGVKGT